MSAASGLSWRLNYWRSQYLASVHTLFFSFSFFFFSVYNQLFSTINPQTFGGGVRAAPAGAPLMRRRGIASASIGRGPSGPPAMQAMSGATAAGRSSPLPKHARRPLPKLNNNGPPAMRPRANSSGQRPTSSGDNGARVPPPVRKKPPGLMGAASRSPKSGSIKRTNSLGPPAPPEKPGGGGRPGPKVGGGPKRRKPKVRAKPAGLSTPPPVAKRKGKPPPVVARRPNSLGGPGLASPKPRRAPPPS